MSDKIDPIRLAQAALAERRANGETIVRKTWREKLQEKPTSATTAIGAHCWECAGGGADGVGETKKTIKECQVDCSLKNFRPYK